MRSSQTIPLAILIGGIIVAGAVYYSLASKAPSTGSDRGNPALVRPVDSRDHIIGNPSAPIMIVTYSDYDCTYCKTFYQTMLRVIANHGPNGKVAWVHRQFPLTEIHQNAQKHAEAAECVAQVGGNDAFWKFSAALFAGQPTDPSRYGTLAQQAGAPSEAFQQCYVDAAREVDARIAADRQNALDTGAVGTPYSLILMSGRTPIVMDGAYTEDAVELLVGQLLAS